VPIVLQTKFCRRHEKGKYLSGKKITPSWEFTLNRIVFIAIFALVLPAPFYLAEAAEIRAFHNINQLPFKQIFGLPSLDNSPLTEAGKWRLNVIANLSNTNDLLAESGEQLTADAEIFRSGLIVSYAPRNNWQLSVEVPYIRYNGGFLDNFIYDWHEFLGLSTNGRTKDNSNQLHISYLADSGPSFEMTDSEGGLGDIRINCTYSRPWAKRALIFSTEVKFPTGDYDKLTGSGDYDFSAGLTLNDPQSLGKYRITLFGGLAGIFLGDIDGEMAAVQNNFAVAGRIGIGWQATRLIQLKLQIDGQSALYDSDLKGLGNIGFQLVMGGSLAFTDDVYLDISVAENLNTATAVDAAFQLALVATF